MLNSFPGTMETVWNTIQEPRCSVQHPASYMLLLSAIDQGWKIARVESVPSWDQHGFVYLVSLKSGGSMDMRELILPQNRWTEDLLRDNYGGFPLELEGFSGNKRI